MNATRTSALLALVTLALALATSACTAETDLDAVLFSCVKDSDCVGKKICKSPPGVCLDPGVSVEEALPDYQPDASADADADADHCLGRCGTVMVDQESSWILECGACGPGQKCTEAGYCVAPDVAPDVTPDVAPDVDPCSCEGKCGVWSEPGCEEALYCGGCEPGQECSAGNTCVQIPPECSNDEDCTDNDGVECTESKCAGGTCTEVPNDTICTENGFSTGETPCDEATCDPNAGCLFTNLGDTCGEPHACATFECNNDGMCAIDHDDPQGLDSSKCGTQGEDADPCVAWKCHEVDECVENYEETAGVDCDDGLSCTHSGKCDGEGNCDVQLNCPGPAETCVKTEDPELIAIFETGVCVPAGWATRVEVGRDLACAITSDGQVACWGAANLLGTGSIVSPTLAPSRVVLPGAPEGEAIDLAVGVDHACVLWKANEAVTQVYCWGDEGGQATYSAHYVNLEAWGSPWTITAGDGFTCALLPGGQVACWGDNDRGQCGAESDDLFLPPSLVREAGKPSGVLTGVTSVDAGGDTACAVVSGNQVACWGDNTWGQHAGGGTPDGVNTPFMTYPVLAETWPPAGIDSLTNVSSVEVGDGHVCVVFVTDEVACWGRATHSQFGLAAPEGAAGYGITQKIEDWPGIKQLALGGRHTCGLTLNPTAAVSCMGDNGSKQSGGELLSIIASGSIDDVLENLEGDPSETAVQVSAGDASTCALMADGSVLCWGRDPGGQDLLVDPDSPGASGTPTAIAHCESDGECSNNQEAICPNPEECCIAPDSAACNDAGACFWSNLESMYGCDDGDACTGAEGGGWGMGGGSDKDHCGFGICLAGPSIDCEDEFECTNDECEAGEGCSHTAVDGDCDDGIACTSETCSEEDGCIIVEDDGECDDGDACTIDKCGGANSASPGCSHIDNCLTGHCIGSSGNPQACFEYSDKSFVEFGESQQLCEGQGGTWTEGLCPVSDETLGDVVAGCWNDKFSFLQWYYTSSEMTSEDVLAQCAPSVCDPATYTCTKTNDGVPCETTADCDNGVHACVLVGCAGTQCTNELCVTSVGCLPDTHKPDGMACLDNDMCTRDDTCQSGECTGGPLYDCNEDDDACTAELCYGPTPEYPDVEEYGCFPEGNACAEYTCLFPSQKLCVHINVPNADGEPNEGLCVPLADGQPSSGAPGFVCPQFLEVAGDGEGPGAAVGGCTVDVGTQYAMTNWYYDGTRNSSDCGGACDDDWSAENIPCADGEWELPACELSLQSEVTTAEDICGPPSSICTLGALCSVSEGQDNGCWFPASDNGSACGEQELCTDPGTCLDGTCVAEAKDCSYLDTPCIEGTCNAVTGACQSTALDEAALCDDGDPCTAQTRCYSNTCESGIGLCADQSLTAGEDKDASNQVRRAVAADGEGGLVVFFPNACSTEDGYAQAFPGGCVGGRIVNPDGSLRSMDTHIPVGVPGLVGEGAEIVHLDAARGPGGEDWILAVAWRSGLYLSDNGVNSYKIQSKDSVTIIELDGDLQILSSVDVKTTEYNHGVTDDLGFDPASALVSMDAKTKNLGLALSTLMLGDDHALCWSEEAADPSQSDVHCAVQGFASGTTFFDSQAQVHTVADRVTDLEVAGMWLDNLSAVSWVVGTRTWKDGASDAERVEVFGAVAEGTGPEATIVTSDSFVACEGICSSLALASGGNSGAFLVAYGSPSDNNPQPVPTVKGLTIYSAPDFVFADIGTWFSTKGEALPGAQEVHDIRIEFTADDWDVVMVYEMGNVAYLSLVDPITGELLLQDPEDDTSWRIPVALNDAATQHMPLLTEITPDGVFDQDHWEISWTDAERGTLGRRFDITYTPDGATPIVGQPVLTLSSEMAGGAYSQQPKFVALDDWIAAAYQEDVEADGLVNYRVRALDPQGLPYADTALVAGESLQPWVCEGDVGPPFDAPPQPETMWTLYAVDNGGQHEFMLYLAGDLNEPENNPTAGPGIDFVGGWFESLESPDDDYLPLSQDGANYIVGGCTGPYGATPSVTGWPTQPGKVLGFVNGAGNTWAHTDCYEGAYNYGYSWGSFAPKVDNWNSVRDLDITGFEVGAEASRRTLAVWEEVSDTEAEESGIRASLWSGCHDTGELDITIFEPTWVIKQSDTPLELQPEWPRAATTTDGSTMLIAWSLNGDGNANGIYGRVITSYDVVTAPEYIAISTVNTPGMRVSFLEADPTKPGRFLVGWESQEAGDHELNVEAPPKTLVARWIDTTSEGPDPPPFLIPSVSADLPADHGSASISPSGDVVLGWTEAPDWGIETSRALLRIIPSPGD